MSLVAKPDLAKRRARDRRARARHSAMVKALRETRDVLEYATLVTSTVGDTDAVWDDFLDDKTVRLRQSLRLIKEAGALEHERVQLERLLEEHRLASRALDELMAFQRRDDWAWKVERLRDLARVHFQLWTMEDCQCEIAAALKEMNAFTWGQDKVTSGFSFLGWRETRRMDPIRGHFQFEFTKTFRGYEIMDYVNVVWDAYTHPETYKEVILGNRLQCTYELLQQLGPNAMIVRGAQRFLDIKVDVHVCYLVYRVRTENGFLQIVRSIFNPAMQKAIDEPNDAWSSTFHDVWTANFIWLRWEYLPGGKSGYTVQAGGTVVSHDMNHLNVWMFGALASLERSERKATGRQLITSG